jgi:hypothetical protein
MENNINKRYKSFTSLEQSKKLAKILPIESADLYYYKYGLPHFIEGQEDYESIRTDKYRDYIPCWSLVALFGVLPTFTIDRSDNHYYRLHCMERFTEWYDNPIDACVAMIERLHKLNLLLLS